MCEIQNTITIISFLGILIAFDVRLFQMQASSYLSADGTVDIG
jgi:hypothetical protein